MAVQEFLSPTSLSEAQAAFGEGAASSWLAGGTDLLVGIRLGARDPSRVVDLKQIPELTAIEVGETSVQIGAAASAFDVLHNSDVPSLFPGLAEALDLIGSTQIQGRCSAGGNLCNASPAADSIPALIANSAQCRILGPEGERILAVEDFVVGPNQNVISLWFMASVPTPIGSMSGYSTFLNSSGWAAMYCSSPSPSMAVAVGAWPHFPVIVSSPAASRGLTKHSPRLSMICESF